MRAKQSLSTKLGVMCLVFLLAALASTSLTLWGAWQLEGSAAAVNEAGRLRMAVLRIVIARQAQLPDQVALLEQQLDAGIELLHAGDPARPLFIPQGDEPRAHLQRLRATWLKQRGHWNEMTLQQAAAHADEFVAEADALTRAVERQLVRRTAVLQLVQVFIVALAIVAAIAFMLAGYLLVLHPVARLTQALARMRAGDLGTRMVVDTRDEFGELTAGFNRMAEALQVSHEDLERRVREKTASVAEQNQRLSALYAVSALGAEASSLATLAQGFAEQFRQVAASDAATVYWCDEANQRQVLLAADGLPDPLPSEPMHWDDDGRAREVRATFAEDERQKGFSSAITLPVRLQHRLLAEVTLLYHQARELPPVTHELLATMAQHLASSMEGLRASALEREAAVADERGLLARELHDSIAQSLAFLKIQTQLLRDAVAKNNADKRDRTLNELDAGVRECYADVRELLVHFRTRANEEDIEIALRAALSKFQHQSGIAAELRISGKGLPLAADVQIQVLHIVQEALSNVRKHARATQVQLLVRHPPWRFEVCDDGCGFNPATVPPDSLHVGLGIMRERALLIGATIRIDSAPGAGTRVTLEVPVEAERPLSRHDLT